MLTLLETIIGPLWVWLVIGEEPGIRTFAGGSIVVAALFSHACSPSALVGPKGLIV